MKLSHFSNTSAGGEHGYNANGPGSPLKLPILSGPWSLSSEPKSSLVSGYQSSVLVVSLKRESEPQ